MSTPIPPAVWKRLVAFLDAGHTGRIILNVKGGDVRTCEITEIVDAGQRLRVLPAETIDNNDRSMKQSAQ